MHMKCITHGQPPPFSSKEAAQCAAAWPSRHLSKPVSSSYRKGSDPVWARPAKAEAGRKPRKQDSRTAATREVGGWRYGDGWMGT
jgi:hypothetical protein